MGPEFGCCWHRDLPCSGPKGHSGHIEKPGVTGGRLGILEERGKRSVYVETHSGQIGQSLDTLKGIWVSFLRKWKP